MSEMTEAPATGKQFPLTPYPGQGPALLGQEGWSCCFHAWEPITCENGRQQPFAVFYMNAARSGISTAQESSLGTFM